MSDLGLVRYLGYAELAEAAALRRRLEAEQPEHLANGVHLIAVQSEDGSLVVGDSHHYGPTPDPFGATAVDELILGEFGSVRGAARAQSGRALDRHLCLGARPADAGRPAGRPGAAGRDHQRHRRQHLLRHRRGGDRTT